MKTKLSNLEELLLEVRHDSSQKIMKEALDCYHSGSYRSSIICIWQAVVFDFVYKLENLSNKDKLIKFIGEIKEALSFGDEKQGIQNAQKFEREIITERYLIKYLGLTVNENKEIERLYYDRHRCAHPSFYDRQPHEFSAELAASHFVNAIKYILCYESLNKEDYISEFKLFLSNGEITLPTNIEKIISKSYSKIKDDYINQVLREVFFNINVNSFIQGDDIKKMKIKYLLDSLYRNYKEDYNRYIETQAFKLLKTRESNDDFILSIKAMLYNLSFSSLSSEIQEFVLNKIGGIKNKRLLDMVINTDDDMDNKLRGIFKIGEHVQGIININSTTYNSINDYWMSNLYYCQGLLLESHVELIKERMKESNGHNISGYLQNLIEKWENK